MLFYACPRCGATLSIPEGYIGQAGRCRFCNEKFIVTVPAQAPPPQNKLTTCPACDGPVSQEAHSCPHCGQPLKHSVQTQSPVIVEPQSPVIVQTQSPMRLGCIIIVAIIVAMIILSMGM
jgi:DNA-directed RNA polymerase subunit RPC12/RpoP